MKFLKVLFILCAFSAISFADVPNEIRYNGRLKSYQEAVNGTRNINFKIYSVESAGTAVWESGNQSVAISSGIFSYTLQPSVDWSGKDYWIEIVIDNKVLSPREKLSAQVYALHSATAEHINSSNEINIKSGNNTGKMGVNASGEIYTKSNAAGNTEFYMVPKGAIILWSGSVGNIPSGWALCDGTNGTPNLQGRFVLGTGTIRENAVDYIHNPHDFGGEVNHKLTIEEMPSHSHRPQGGMLGRSPSNSLERFLHNAVDNWELETSHTGGDGPHNNMPPYFVLCYIMKL